MKDESFGESGSYSITNWLYKCAKCVWSFCMTLLETPAYFLVAVTALFLYTLCFLTEYTHRLSKNMNDRKNE